MRLSGANILMGGLEGRFDGHAHVFSGPLSMDANRRYTPARDAPLAEYLEHLWASGLDGAILVQPSFLGVDNSHLLEVLARAKRIETMEFRGVVAIEPSASEKETAQMAEAGVIGIRLNLFGGRPSTTFDIERSKQLLRRVSDLGWHIELHCEGHRLAGLLPVVLDHCDRVVVDHFGLPDPDRPLACPGQAAILGAPHGRVFVKVSAPYRVFRDRQSAEAAECCKPVFKRLLDVLGPKRLLWGSDWPWTQYEDRHDFACAVGWERLWLSAQSTTQT